MVEVSFNYDKYYYSQVMKKPTQKNIVQAQ